jgi:site-specific DNA-methyltransferase (cytosine-N4-specific)
MVSTGEIGASAREYANKVMADSNIAIVMIDRADIENIVENPAFIIYALNREAKHAMKLKKLDI